MRRTDKSWYYSHLDGPVASWIDDERLDEQKRLLPDIAYRRLWLNEWTTGIGDALLPDDIDRAFEDDLPQLNSAEANYAYVGGLDLSVSKDFASFVVVGKHQTGRYRIARVWLWKPPTGGKIDQGSIEATILRANKSFRLKKIGADPWQCEYLITRLKRANVNIEAQQQSGANLVQQALMVLEQFNSSNIDCPQHDQLEYDLRHLRVQEKSYGCRLSSPRDGSGHGDTATALSIALAVAKPLQATRRVFNGDWMSDELIQRVSERRHGVTRRPPYFGMAWPARERPFGSL